MISRLLVVFLSLGFLFLILFGYPVIFQIYHNLPYTETVAPTSVKWSIEAIHDEEWRPKAQFQYVVSGKNYENSELFQGESFRNPFKAEAALKDLEEQYHTVWYAPRNPSNATLEKYFPIKRAIYCGILFAIMSYFIWFARLYLSRISQRNDPKGR